MKKNLHVSMEVILVLIISVSLFGCKKIFDSSLSSSSKDLLNSFSFKRPNSDSFIHVYKLVAKSKHEGCSSIVYPWGTSEDIYTFNVYGVTSNVNASDGVAIGSSSNSGEHVSFIHELNFRNDCFPYTIHLLVREAYKDEFFLGETVLEKPSNNSNEVLSVDINLKKIANPTTSLPNSNIENLSSIFKEECKPLQLMEVEAFRLRTDTKLKGRVVALADKCKGRFDLLKDNLPFQMSVDFTVDDLNGSSVEDSVDVPDLWGSKIYKTAIYSIDGNWAWNDTNDNTEKIKETISGSKALRETKVYIKKQDNYVIRVNYNSWYQIKR